MGNLHVNFTILVYSPPKLLPYFIPFLNSHIFADAIFRYCFTHQSYPFAHLNSFHRITKFTTVYGSSVIQFPSAPIEAVRSPINSVFASVFILEQTEYD